MVAVGEIVETLPVTFEPMAAMEIAASWPTATSARSLSTTSVVISNVELSMMTAGPDGASKPGWTSTSVTRPSIGAVILAALIWALRSVTCCCASATWFSALYWPILAWRIWPVLPLASASSRVVFAARRLTFAEARLFWAASSWRSRSFVSAVASVSPFLTVSPTLTSTLVTG